MPNRLRDPNDGPVCSHHGQCVLATTDNPGEHPAINPTPFPTKYPGPGQSLKCSCDVGFKGVDCSQVSGCRKDECNQGTCDQRVGACACASTLYSGKFCEISAAPNVTKLDSIVKLTADQEAKSKVWSDFHLIESEAYHHYVIPRPNLDYPLRITVKADGESTAEKVALHLYASASYEPVKRLPNSIYSSWESETTPMSPKNGPIDNPQVYIKLSI